MPVTRRPDPTQSDESDEWERWPGAPELVVEDGEPVNAEAWCPSCGSPSTLCYRCSECGNDLATGGSA